MALVKTEGVVFKCVKYRETSLIVDIYTRAMGLKSYIINGARRPKSKMPASYFQLGNILSFVAYDSERTSLNRIKEIRIEQPYHSLPYQIQKSALATFLVELVRNTIREEEQNALLFNFLKERFYFLDNSKQSVANFHLKFLLDYAGFVGFAPMDNYSIKKPYFHLEEGQFWEESHATNILDEGKSYCIHLLLNTEVEKVFSLEIKKKIRLELLNALVDYYRYHIESFRPLKSLAIYQQLF